jgi:metabolite-proton symporter
MAESEVAPANSPLRIFLACLLGTTVEYFDFYIYATAAVLVFPKLFFPVSDPTSATLQSLATFALAFFARPIGSVLFGHFGDRIGRKATLVAALLTMGLSTVCIGLLPTYATIGVLAPVLLALCRLGQGLGLGGEWGGAVLLAMENAPPGRRVWYGMFPMLGSPLGFLTATSVFLLLTDQISDAQFLHWGWRLPFLFSAVLVLLGLYIRLRLEETPDFQRVLASNERVRVPMRTVLVSHWRGLLIGMLAAAATFLIFYLMAVFTLSWGTGPLGYARRDLLLLQMVGVLCQALLTPVSAVVADRLGTKPVLIGALLGVMAFGLAYAPLFASGTTLGLATFLCLGLGLIGFTYGPLGTALAQLFPAAVRYTGAALTFNLAGILGASLAPYFATALATHYGLGAVGYCLSGVGLISLLATLCIRTQAGQT